MRVTATVLALSSMFPGSADVLSRSIGAKTMLEQVVSHVAALEVVDACVVVSDIPHVIARNMVQDVPVVECPETMRDFAFNALSIETYLLCMERNILQAVDCKGDVSFIIPAQMPLLSTRTLERMYHRLLEDPLASRVTPICKTDPQIYMRTSDDAFFPVWVHRGVDRQQIQQLYRTCQASVSHMGRIGRGIPKVIGLEVSKLELITATDAESLALAAYVAARRTDPPSP